jgi:hypothetical protein
MIEATHGQNKRKTLPEPMISEGDASVTKFMLQLLHEVPQYYV